MYVKMQSTNNDYLLEFCKLLYKGMIPVYDSISFMCLTVEQSV